MTTQQDPSQLRTEAAQFTHHSLASKFERSTRTIAKVAQGAPVRDLPNWERDLILACIAERKRLLSAARATTGRAVSRREVGA